MGQVCQKCLGLSLLLMANWEGYEDLRKMIIGKIPHFGNGIPECDQFMTFAAKTYAESINCCVGPRGNHYSAGCYPVTLNVVFGYSTAATPDGRFSGEPLAEAISPKQGRNSMSRSRKPITASAVPRHRATGCCPSRSKAQSSRAIPPTVQTAAVLV